MKKNLLALFILISSLQIIAQPAYDDCPSFDLGTAPFCEDMTFFNNVGATTSNIGSFNVPPCWKNADLSRDVWISFVASDTILDYVITVTGKADGATKAMLYPEIALYRGDCAFDELAIVLCASYNPTVSDTTVVLNATGLTPGAVYYMRIHDNKGDGSSNPGSFVLCVKQKEPIIKIINGFSNACAGKITDTGGDDNDYGKNEDFFFKICPAGFSQCITFTLDYYNIDDAGDYINLYDGDNVSAPLLANLTSANGGSGGVAFQVQAKSGCVSIQFHSDGSVEEDGFLAHWQCSTSPCDPPTPIMIGSTPTEAQIIAAVSTPLTIVTVDTVICSPSAYGTFAATDNSLLGLKKGFLLTSGTAQNAVGPNNSTSMTGTSTGPGDADLDYLSVQQGNSSLSHDACILELDVYSAGDELSFEYVFGSEEYPEYVGSGFNDIFAFLISGPGIVGDPNIANQKNIAILPDGTTFVQINSVNDNTNWEYYRDNIASPSIQYDGLTSDYKGIKKSLTATQKVTPCNTYHLKMAIADRGDYSFDSGVFVSDIKGGAVGFDIAYTSGIDYMIENCTGTDIIKVKLSNILDYPVTYNVVVSGTAINGVDYNLAVPATVTFLPGETEKEFSISPNADGLNEGIETIILQLTNNFGCGTVVYTTTTIELHDRPYATILAGLDTVLYCKGGKINLSVKGGQTYFWQPISIMDNFESPTPVATPTMDGWIYVTGQVGTCAAADSIYAKQIDPKVNILTQDVNLCQGSQVQLMSTNNTGGQGFSWYPPLGLNNTKISNPIASPLVVTKYYAQINLSGCVVKDSVTIFVDPFSFPTIFNDTLMLCQTYPVKLASDIFFSTTTFQWSPGKYLDNPLVSGPVATPDEDITYTLIAKSQNGYCADTAKVFIDVIEADVDILNAVGIEKDTFYLCKGDSMELKSYIFPLGSQIVWSSLKDTTLKKPTTGSVIVKPTESLYYVAKLTTSQCVVYDSVFVQVDSLPQELNISPKDTTVCQGAIVVLKGNVYEQSNFKNIVFNWEPTFDAQTPDSLYNIVIQANATTKYTRYSNSGACTNISTSQVNVIPTNYIQVSPQNGVICPGKSIELVAFAPGVTQFEWSPSGAVSCPTCDSTIATVNSTTTFNVKGEFMGCPIEGSTTVQVSGLPSVAFPQNNLICLGDQITLNTNPDPGNTYLWTSTDPAFGGSVAADPTVSPTTNATYFVTVTNSLGCSSTQQFDVVIAPEPSVSITDNLTICDGNPVTLVATGNIDGTFVWSDGQQGAVITVNPSVTTTYSVTFTDKNNCGTATDQMVLTVESVPAVDIKVTPDTTFNLHQGDKVTLEAIFAGSGTNLTYNWLYQNSPLDLHTKIIEVTPFDAISVYTVVVSSPNGCSSYKEVAFNVEEPIYDIPNVFTPNGDGKNDVFTLFSKGENLALKEFKVYSRWGQLVFDDITKGWDGKNKDEPVPSDVYVYWIVLDTPKGEVVLKGDITVIR